MVKGVSRRVIVVKAPDPKLFEEAIFIVREAPFQREGVSEDQVLRQARQAAHGYLAQNTPGRTGTGLSAALWAAAGAAAASLLWVLALFLAL